MYINRSAGSYGDKAIITTLHAAIEIVATPDGGTTIIITADPSCQIEWDGATRNSDDPPNIWRGIELTANIL